MLYRYNPHFFPLPSNRQEDYFLMLLLMFTNVVQGLKQKLSKEEQDDT